MSQLRRQKPQPLASTTQWQFMNNASRQWVNFLGADSAKLTDAMNDSAESVTLKLNGTNFVCNMQTRQMAEGGSELAFRRNPISVRHI